MTVSHTQQRADLRWLLDAYLATQKLRISIGNRIDAVERETDQAPVTTSIGKLHKNLIEAEAGIRKDMDEALVGHPAMIWLGRVKGVGPTLATKLFGLIGDISTFTTASKLWRYAGLAVIDGKRERPRGAFCPHCGKRGRAKAHPCPVLGETIEVVGEKLHYNVKLKTTLFLIAGSFLKAGSPYVRIYREARVTYLQRATGKPRAWCEEKLETLTRSAAAKKSKDRTVAKAGEALYKATAAEIEAARVPGSWTSAHQHLAALRKMEKLFLVHLWKTWREALGLPTPVPYVFAHPGSAPHTDELPPEDFVKPEREVEPEETEDDDEDEDA
jgi:Transposase IS116/IS110/IS902 family